MNKKLYKLILGSYLGTFFVTFSVAMLFLIMQFLWKWIDDLMGKGLDGSIMVELVFYASANLVPMALPIAILLSSIMTFGGLAETNEMIAMKSAGLSNLKIMRPLIIFIFVISIGSFFFANYTWPVANLKLRALVSDIAQQKPSLQFREKVFNTDIDNFCIRIDKKIKGKNDEFEGVKIADHTAQLQTNSPLHNKDIYAKKGNIKKTVDGKYMVLTLEKGVIQEELFRGIDSTDIFPHQTTYFNEAKLRIDLSSLQLHRTNTDLFKGFYEMFNMEQLNHAIDSTEKESVNLISNYSDGLKRTFMVFRDPVNNDETHKEMIINENAPASIKAPMIGSPVNDDGYANSAQAVRNNISSLDVEINSLNNNIKTIRLMKVEWHRKLILPVACLILFFIGSSLGMIIKKGGVGAPMVASIILFLVYYMISISGEKMAKEGVLEPYIGMWLSAIILTPIAVFLTSKSNADSRIFDKDTYLQFFKRRSQSKKVNLAAEQPE